MGSWWGSKVRQFRVHLLARVPASERRALAAWAMPAELDLFDRMHRADQRHGLDVVQALRRAGFRDREVLVAGLLHDCGKGDTGVGPRVAWSLGETYGSWVHGLAARVPGWDTALERLRHHEEASAALVARAGGSPRTVELIRHQADPVDPVAGRALKLADEAS
jgi:hypothetical protein